MCGVESECGGEGGRGGLSVSHMSSPPLNTVYLPSVPYSHRVSISHSPTPREEPVCL